MDRFTSCRLALAFALIAVLGGCGGDDGPANPAALGTPENPERVTMDTPLTASLAPGDPYYLAFTTSRAGDYIPSVSADQPMAWILYRTAGGAAKIPEGWTIVGDCGEIRKVGAVACAMTGLDADTRYVLALFNQGSAAAAYSLTVTQGQGVGSIADPVAWVGSIANCSESFQGQVGTRFSYYKVSEQSPSGTAGSYEFRALSADADFTVYSDPDFSVLLGTSVPSGGIQYIVFTIPEGGVFYLRADGSRTEAGATFEFACD